MRVLVKQRLLVVFIILPADVAGVVVPQQDVPLLARFSEAAYLAGAPVDDLRSLGPPAERIGAGIQRVVQNLNHAVIGRCLPDDLADINVAQNDGHLDVG